MSAEQELYQGPVMPWTPSKRNQEIIDTLLASYNPLENAYGQAYQEGFFVQEFDGIAAVGEFYNIGVVEFRTGQDIQPQQLTMAECINLGAYPGTGETRVERVLEALNGARKWRQEKEERERLRQQYLEHQP